MIVVMSKSKANNAQGTILSIAIAHARRWGFGDGHRTQ